MSEKVRDGVIGAIELLNIGTSKNWGSLEWFTTRVRGGWSAVFRYVRDERIDRFDEVGSVGFGGRSG